MAETMVLRDGVYTALVTPFTATGAIDKAAWIKLLERQLAAGVSGVVPVGCTGEAAVLTRAEQEYLVRSAVEACAGRAVVVAGSGTNCTETSIAATRDVTDWGADVAMLITPYYNKPQQHGLRAHYRAIARAVDIPIMLYNVPGRTAVDLEPDTSIRLARHPRIVAIKEAVADSERVRRLAEGGLVVLSGDDPSCCESMLVGASGVVSVAANVVPHHIARLCGLAEAGDAETARSLNDSLRDLYRFLSIEANPVPVKWMVHRLGRCLPALRLPLVALDRSHEALGEQVVEQLSLDAASDVA